MINPSIASTPSLNLPTHPDNFPPATSTGPMADDWSDFQTGVIRLGQGRLETLAQLAERGLEIDRYQNGVVEVKVQRPPITEVLLSGGGAKGVAFSGMVKAMEAFKTLEGVRTISGSSAGAISAAFLACGMVHADFDKMSDETKLIELLDSHNKVLGPIQKVSSVIGKGIAKAPGNAGTVGQLLFDLLPRLQSKAVPLEDLLHEKMVTTIQSRFEKALENHRQLSQQTVDCVDRIKTRGHVTFGDLATLSKDMPEIKQLNITGTAMFDGRPQLVVFNASLTPDMDVARAARISGSLPIVFQRPTEEGLPFQSEGERTSFQDGGIMLNTPIMELYEPHFPMSPIPEEDQLILKFESENDGAGKDRGTLLSTLADKFVGVHYTAQEALMQKGSLDFGRQTIVVPLKTEKGNFTGTVKGTVNFSMPLDDKNYLQKELEIKVAQYLRNHERSETYTFNSIGGALLALDDQLFEAVAKELQHIPGCEEVINFRQHAQETMMVLSQALSDAKKTTKKSLSLTEEMRKAIRTLDLLGDTPGKTEWLAKKLNHGNTPDYMELLQAVKRMDAGTEGPKSVVLTEAIKEMNIRDIAIKSANFIREVIYPSLYHLGQPDSNVKLLSRAIFDLQQARNVEDFNNVLKRITEEYVSRTFPNSKSPLNSTTIEQAKAWLIPDN